VSRHQEGWSQARARAMDRQQREMCARSSEPERLPPNSLAPAARSKIGPTTTFGLFQYPNAWGGDNKALLRCTRAPSTESAPLLSTRPRRAAAIAASAAGPALSLITTSRWQAMIQNDDEKGVDAYCCSSAMSRCKRRCAACATFAVMDVQLFPRPTNLTSASFQQFRAVVAACARDPGGRV